MLTNKGYCIPKYLYKRKLTLLKGKIIKRKYGYLFFRKTISIILPSQAIHHYESKLKKNALRAWIILWYQERIEWKLLIKANIHFQFNLLQKSLQQWKCFQKNKRSSKLKKQLAVIYSRKIARRQILSGAFCKWKLYKIICNETKRKNVLAKKFFRSKCGPEFLKIYFKRWQVLKSVSLRNKLRIKEAVKYYELHLINICFEKIKTYQTMSKNKKEYQRKHTLFYEKKLLRKIVETWKKFILLQLHTKENLILARTHFIFKIKQKSLRLFRIHKDCSKEIKRKLNCFQLSQSERLLRKYYQSLKMYTGTRRMKTYKVDIADTFYIRNISRKIIHKLLAYVSYRSNKRILQRNRIVEIKLHLKNIKICFIFNKWRHYSLSRRSKKQKMLKAIQSYDLRIVKSQFTSWTNLWLQGKFKRSQIIQICGFYNERLIRKHFNIWKCITEEALCFQRDFKNAVDLYNRYIIEEGLLLIVKLGLMQKDDNYKKCSQICGRRVFLSYKYFSLWRRKTLQQSFNKGNFIEQESLGSKGILEWYPICFLAPRIVQT